MTAKMPAPRPGTTPKGWSTWTYLATAVGVAAVAFAGNKALVARR